MKWVLSWLLTLAIFASVPAYAVDYPQRPTGPILDAANILPPDREAALDARLRAENAKTGRALVIATVPSLQGETIEMYAVKLFEAWGIGGKETDQGLLLLVAPNERQVRIEVGYGLHGYVTDGLSGRIIRTIITPRFKAGDLPGGIEAGTDALLQQLARTPEDAKAVAEAAEAAQRGSRQQGATLGDFIKAIVIVVVVLLFIIISSVRAASRGGRRYRQGGGVHPIVIWAAGEALNAALRNRDHDDWGGGGGFGGFGGGGGGGFGGFGGGGSGGGGASGGLVMAQQFKMSEADHDIVVDAVAKAEAHTDAEIVTIVARRSDAYHDVGLHWAILCAFLVLAIAAAFPVYYESLIIWMTGGWVHEVPLQTLLLFLLGHMLLKFLAVRYLLAIPALRMVFTPRSTKARRVRRQALKLFRIAAQSRTARLTGVLLYLSLDEHRAELVADEAIASKVPPEVWGEAIAALVDEAKQGRIAQGMARAIEKAGVVLAEHCPHSEHNPNELPDRLIEL